MRYGRTPDTVSLLGVLAIAGTLLTLTGNTPGSVDEVVPYWLGLVWSAVFTLSACVALAGTLWRDALTGWTLELAGRIGLAFTAGAYVVALFNTAAHWGSSIVIAMVASLSFSSAWRVYQLTRKLDNFRTAVIEQARGGGR